MTVACCTTGDEVCCIYWSIGNASQRARTEFWVWSTLGEAYAPLALQPSLVLLFYARPLASLSSRPQLVTKG